jgi:hypothetical protein
VPPVFSAKEANMTKWDYKTVVLTGGFMGRHKDELKREALEAQFDELGRQGFELSWILMNQALQGEKDGHVVIFKRPIDTDAAPQSPTSEAASQPPSTDIFARPPAGEQPIE